MINTNPEKRLSEILQFKSASKLVKDLRKEMCGMPTVDIVTDNLYNYVTRITTETSNQSYTNRARPIKRGKLASFFEIRRERKDRPRLGSRQQEKRGSITKQERQQLQPQKQRRQSCLCTECGRENLKIKRLGLVGINTIKQIPHIIELKQRRTLLLDLINFCIYILIIKKIKKNSNQIKQKSAQFEESIQNAYDCQNDTSFGKKQKEINVCKLGKNN